MPGEVVTSHQELMCNFFAQPDALALGKDIPTLAAAGVPEALQEHKCFSGDRPSLAFLFKDSLTAFNCGQLLAIYEHRVAAEGFIFDCNSFDQWGVELGKVLAKESQNPLALAALEKIIQRYYVLLKASLNKGKVEQARVFWSRAKKIIPKHSELAKMRALIENHHVKQQMMVVSEPVTEVPALRTQKLLLPVHLIKQQDKQLAQWLVMLAKKAHDLQATMLIVAPRDTQARWVYQAMNSADPEQRIRANIKHSRPARLEISYLARKDELEIYGN